MKTGKYNRRKCYSILQQVCTKEGVPASMVKPRFYQQFKDAELMYCFQSGRGYVYVSNLSFDELKEKTKILFGMDLDKWAALTCESTREDVAAATGSSKAESTKVDYGFNCNVYPKPVEYEHDGTKHTVMPSAGLSLLVSDWRKFYIPKGTVIISTENYSPLFNVEKYDPVWNNGQEYFFVLRNGKIENLIKWLNTNQPDNEVYHFGDYDMKGIEIYQTIKKKITNKERYHFYKPSMHIIREQIKASKSDLYFKQYNYARVDESDEEVKDIVSLIKRYGKTIEQESFPGFFD